MELRSLSYLAVTARSAPRTAFPRRRSAVARRAATLLLAAMFATPAAASAGSIELKSAFAGPIASSNPLCTAEPRGLVYGTTNFNAGQPLSHRSHGYPGVTFYEPANAPSYLDLLPNTQASATSDLCAGFTLPPNVEPQLKRDWYNDAPRLQDDPEWPDLADTHVSTFPSGTSPVHGDDLRNLAITLPAGYSLDFAAAPECTAGAFGAGNYAASSCPAATQLGEAFVRVSAYSASAANHATLTGLALYNLAPGAGEAGRLGLSFKAVGALAPTKWIFAVRLAGDGSGRLVADVADAPRLTYDAAAIASAGDPWNGNSADTLASGDPRIGQPQPAAPQRPLYVEGLSLRLWGAKSSHPTLASDFGAQAGQCAAPLNAKLAADTYGGHASGASSGEYALMDCGSLTLPATAAAAITAQAAGAPTGASFDLDLPQSGARLPAQPAALELALPQGVELGPQLASGDQGQPTCTAEQFGASGATPSACPDAAAAGTVALRVRGAGSLSGTAYLGLPERDGDLATLLVDAAAPAGPGRLKFTGALSVDEAGHVTITFDELPQARLAGFKLTLRGGDHALLTAPRSCGIHAGSATLDRASGTSTVAAFGIAVTAGCDAAAPQLTAAPSTSRSAGRTATSVTLTRAAGGADLDRVELNLPPGLVIAPASIPECAAPEAAAGACAPASQLGTVTLQAGAGDRPLKLTGGVFRTAAPDGAFAGATISADVQLGDLDLGRFVAPATLRLDSFGRNLSLEAALPRRVAGVAIDIRSATFDFDRDGVVRQPTGCGPLPVSATVTAGGVDSTPAATVAYAGCSALEFDPAFTAAVTGDTAVGGRPKVLLTVTPRSSDTGVRSAALSFPPTLALDTTGAAECDLAVFEAASCPSTTKIGVAGGKVAIANDFLGGDVFLVRVPGASAPAAGIRFGGSFRHRVLGRFGAGDGGATVLSFDALPDLPLSRWAVQFDGGSSGVIKAVPPAAGCTASTQWTADLAAHNGARARRGSAVTCGGGSVAPGESPVVELSVSAKTGIKLKLTKFGAQQLQAAKLTMPKPIRINPPKAKRRGRTSIALIGSKATPVFTKGSLTLTPYGGVPSEVVARLRITAYTINGRAPDLVAGTLKGKKRTVDFRLRLAFRDGTVKERSISVRLP